MNRSLVLRFLVAIDQCFVQVEKEDALLGVYLDFWGEWA
jgi:hypothetical protein